VMTGFHCSCCCLCRPRYSNKAASTTTAAAAAPCSLNQVVPKLKCGAPLLGPRQLGYQAIISTP
jgi:hypothetical protein